jgi:hypothetical protein
MPILTHFAPEKSLGSIRRSGIKAYPWAFEKPHGVFCMPVLPNFLVTHQWLRELKRRGQRTMFAIDFRMRSDQPIWFGHYGPSHAEISLGRAIGILMRTPDALGWEVIIPRSIRPDEIVRVRRPSQILGWRYFPNSHDKRPTCACRMCLPKGMIKSRRLRDRLDPTGENY